MDLLPLKVAVARRSWRLCLCEILKCLIPSNLKQNIHIYFFLLSINYKLTRGLLVLIIMQYKYTNKVKIKFKKNLFFQLFFPMNFEIHENVL